MSRTTYLRISATWVAVTVNLYGGDIQSLLWAPVADSEIRLQLSPSLKSIQWDIPETRIDFQLLPDGKVFLSRDAVKIAYTSFNPLKVKVSATTKRSEAPEATVVGDLMTGMLSVLSTVAPNAPGLTDLVNARAGRALVRGPGPCSTLQADLRTLADSLNSPKFGPKALTTAAKGWSDAIDTAFTGKSGTGPAAMKRGGEAVGLTLKDLSPVADAAQKAWDNINACANSTVTQPDEVPVADHPAARPQEPKEPVGPPPPAVALPGGNASATEREKYNKFLADQAAYTARLQAQLKYRDDLDLFNKQEEAATKYNEYRKALREYLENQQERTDALQIVVVKGIIVDKIAALKSFISSGEEIAKSLDTLSASSNWFDGDSKDYLLLVGTVKPSSQEMETVTVEFTPITYESDLVKNVFTAKSGTAVKVNFDVRWYSNFVPEIGVGAVFGSVTEPQYGTGTSPEGKTVVVKVPSKSISVAPTVMVNFVYRTRPSYLVPMIQIGAAASKAAPAILIGGGLRIPGAAGFAIGGGAMFAWMKDLKTLSVGQVVSGSAAIDADRGFNSQPTIGGYFTIQYTFGK